MSSRNGPRRYKRIDAPKDNPTFSCICGKAADVSPDQPQPVVGLTVRCADGHETFQAWSEIDKQRIAYTQARLDEDVAAGGITQGVRDAAMFDVLEAQREVAAWHARFRSLRLPSPG